MASSRFLTAWIDATGPKISSRPIAMRGRHVVEHGRADEESVLAPGDLHAAAVEHQLRALFDAFVDVAASRGRDAAPLITGPIWTPGSRPSPTFRLRAESTSRSRASRCASPTGTSTLPARHRSPAQP